MLLDTNAYFRLAKRIWHGFELLDKLRSAKVVDASLIRDLYAALEANGDLPRSWREAKHPVFLKIFGAKPR